jgi:hypothetical protein
LLAEVHAQNKQFTLFVSTTVSQKAQGQPPSAPYLRAARHMGEFVKTQMHIHEFVIHVEVHRNT